MRFPYTEPCPKFHLVIFWRWRKCNGYGYLLVLILEKYWRRNKGNEKGAFSLDMETECSEMKNRRAKVELNNIHVILGDAFNVENPCSLNHEETTHI